jgi:hypothetical protein
VKKQVSLHSSTAKAVESGGLSVQALMNDQPQPACGRPENNSAERSGVDHYGAKQ